MAKKSTTKRASRKRAAPERPQAVEVAERLVAAARKAIKRPEPPEKPNDVEVVRRMCEARGELRKEMRRTILGMDRVIDEILAAVVARGHVLIEAAPGLAMTPLVSSLAKALSLTFARIACTPDLLRSDLIGNEVRPDDLFEDAPGRGFGESPLFAHVVLAEEIDRAPPRIQTILLDAMLAAADCLSGDDPARDTPFVVLASRNPQAEASPAPLTELQRDCFLLEVAVPYPGEEEEIEMLRAAPGMRCPDVRELLTRRDLLAARELVDRVPAADHVLRYAAALVRATRPTGGHAPGFVEDFVAWGCGPRASLDLIGAAKARAILHGRFHVAVEDVREMLRPALRHRLGLTFTAQSEGVDAAHVIARLLDEIPSDEPLADRHRRDSSTP